MKFASLCRLEAFELFRQYFRLNTFCLYSYTQEGKEMQRRKENIEKLRL